MINIHVVIVSWNSWKDIKELIPTLDKAKGKSYRLKYIVVENGSTDESPQKLPKLLPRKVEYIDTKENLGYAGGVNVGTRWALDNRADFVFVLNPDTTVDEKVFNELLKPFSNPKVGIVGPRIYYYDEPDLIWWTGAKLNLRFGKIINEGFKVQDQDYPQGITKEDYISGCAMLIKKEVFDQIGLFDESYFHTSEETDFCLRTREAGYKLLVNPKAKVWHKIGISSGGEYGPTHMYYLDKNRLFLMKKQGYWIPVISWFLVSPLLIKRLLAAIIRGRKMSSVTAYLAGIRDFSLGRIGKRK